MVNLLIMVDYITQEELEYLNKMIVEDNRKVAIEFLSVLVSKYDRYSYLTTHVKIIGVRNESLKKQILAGIINYENKQIETGKITNDLLLLVEELKSGNKFKWKIKKIKKFVVSRKGIAIIGILLPFFMYMFDKINEANDAKSRELEVSVELLKPMIEGYEIPRIDSFISNGQNKYYLNSIANDVLTNYKDILNDKRKSVLTTSKSHYKNSEIDDLSLLKSIEVEPPKISDGFPVLNFTLLNQTDKTILITDIVVENKELALDKTPELYFHWGLQNNNLALYTYNNGWGAALDCSCDIKNKFLNNHFTSKSEIRNFDIEAGFNGVIDSIKVENMDSVSESILLDSLNCLLSDSYISKEYQIPAILVIDQSSEDENEKLWISCKYKSEMGDFFDMKFIEVKPPLFVPTVYLTEHGFSDTGGNLTSTSFKDIQYSYKSMEVMYACFIDNGLSLKYRASQSIQPGEVDRFGIILATRKSCYSTTRIKLLASNGEEYASEWFDLKLYSPRNKEIFFKDGEVLKNIYDSEQTQDIE